MLNNQFYGVKYPFTSQDSENYFVDLNYDIKEYTRSILMHLVFTPKGQKIRDLEFGTNLIKYIFEPSDNISWGDIRREVQETVNRYLPFITINEIKVLETNGDFRDIHVRLDYSVSSGIKSFSDSFVTTL